MSRKLLMSDEEMGRTGRRREREKKRKQKDDIAAAKRERITIAKDIRVQKDEMKLMKKQDEVSHEWSKKWNFQRLQERLKVAANIMSSLREECKRRGLSFELPPDIKGVGRYPVLTKRIEHFDKMEARKAEATQFGHQHRAHHKNDKPKIKAFNVGQHEREMDKSIREATFPQIINVLRRTNVSPDYSTARGLNAMIRAIYHRQVGIVRLLLEEGAGINIESPHGWTPLIYACYSGQLEMVAFLLDQGIKRKADTEEELARRKQQERVEVDYENKRGWTALMSAAKCGHEAVIMLLIARGGVNIDKQSTVDGFTALMHACRHRHFLAAVRLLRAGAKTDLSTGKPFVEMKMDQYRGMTEVMNYHGHSSRTLCRQYGFSELISEIEKYAAKYAPKKSWRDPDVVVAPEKLTYKETLRLRKRAKEYIAMNASLSVGDEEGAVRTIENGLASAEQEEPGTARTALILVASAKTKESSATEWEAWNHVERLLKAGADPGYQNRHGHTALMAAASQGNLVLVAVLLKAGADADGELSDMDGNSAMHLAGRYRQSDVVSLLREVNGGKAVKKGSSKYGAKKRADARAKALRNADAIVQEYTDRQAALRAKQGHGAGGPGSASLGSLAKGSHFGGPGGYDDDSGGGAGLKSSTSTPALVLMESATPETVASVKAMHKAELRERELALEEARGGGELQRMHDRSNYERERHLLVSNADVIVQAAAAHDKAAQERAALDTAMSSRRLPLCEKCIERKNSGMGRFKGNTELPPMRARHRCMNCVMTFCDECFERVHRQPRYAHHRSLAIEPGELDEVPKSIIDTIATCRKMVGKAYEAMGHGGSGMGEAVDDRGVWEMEEKRRLEFERRMEQKEERWAAEKARHDQLEKNRIEASFLDPPELGLARLIMEGEDAQAKQRAAKGLPEEDSKKKGKKGRLPDPSRLPEAVRLLYKALQLQKGHFGATDHVVLRTTNEWAAVVLRMAEETNMTTAINELAEVLQKIRAEEYIAEGDDITDDYIAEGHDTTGDCVKPASDGGEGGKKNNRGRTVDETARAMELAVDLRAQLLVKGEVDEWHVGGRSKALAFYQANIAIWTSLAEAEKRAGRPAIEGMLRLVAFRAEESMRKLGVCDESGGAGALGAGMRNYLDGQKSTALMAAGMRRLSTLLAVSGHADEEVAPKHFADMISSGVNAKHAGKTWLAKTRAAKAQKKAAADAKEAKAPSARIPKGAAFLEHALNLCPKWMFGWRDAQSGKEGAGSLVGNTSTWTRVALAVLICSREGSSEHNVFFHNLNKQAKDAKEAREKFIEDEKKRISTMRIEALIESGEGAPMGAGAFRQNRGGEEENEKQIQMEAMKKKQQEGKRLAAQKKKKDLEDSFKEVEQGPAAYKLLRKINKALVGVTQRKDLDRDPEEAAVAAFRQFLMHASGICHHELGPSLKCLNKKRREAAKNELEKLLKVDCADNEARRLAQRSLFNEVTRTVFDELHDKTFKRYIKDHKEGRRFAKPFDPSIKVAKQDDDEDGFLDDDDDDDGDADVHAAALQALLAKKKKDPHSVDETKIRKARAKGLAKGVRWAKKAEEETMGHAIKSQDDHLAALGETRRKEIAKKRQEQDAKDFAENARRAKVKERRDAAGLLQRLVRRRAAMKTMAGVVMACFEPIYDDNYGRFYFHNKVTGESTWKKPRLYEKFIGAEL
jgi:ankyrin repeat protein